MIEFNPKKILKTAKDRYFLNPKGVHGMTHWYRVQENGLKLAKYNNADKSIIRLFALLHDCCRETDQSDLDHGPRAAEFVQTLRGEIITASDDEFDLLIAAIRDHTNVIHTDEITVATCWDADRLDIGRVGKKIQRKFLNTRIAKNEGIISWAYKRSRNFKF